MNAQATPTLTRLGDHGLTVIHHDVDVRGRRVRDKDDHPEYPFFGQNQASEREPQETS